MARPLVIHANQPALNTLFTNGGVERLSIEPLAPVFAALTAIAIAAGGDKVVSYGVAAFVARFDVI